MDFCMDEYRNRLTEGWIDAKIDAGADGCRDRCRDGWAMCVGMDGWMDGVAWVSVGMSVG
jgi:hypothetical protein